MKEVEFPPPAVSSLGKAGGREEGRREMRGRRKRGRKGEEKGRGSKEGWGGQGYLASREAPASQQEGLLRPHRLH
jgi:hypothetical protein